MGQTRKQTAERRASGRPGREIRYIVLHSMPDGRCAAGTTIHYMVAGESVRQQLRVQDAAWHCGTRGTYFHPYCRNANSIGVALCSETENGRQVFAPDTVRCAQALVRMLMEQYGIPPENVLRHYDVTHRTCPVPFVERAAAWAEFRAGLAAAARPETRTAPDFPACFIPANLVQ